MFLNWAIFSMDLLAKYLTFKISYATFPVILPINEYSTHNKKEFGGCLIKIKVF